MKPFARLCGRMDLDEAALSLQLAYMASSSLGVDDAAATGPIGVAMRERVSASTGIPVEDLLAYGIQDLAFACTTVVPQLEGQEACPLHFARPGQELGAGPKAPRPRFSARPLRSYDDGSDVAGVSRETARAHLHMLAPDILMCMPEEVLRPDEVAEELRAALLGAHGLPYNERTSKYRLVAILFAPGRDAAAEPTRQMCRYSPAWLVLSFDPTLRAKRTGQELRTALFLSQ